MILMPSGLSHGGGSGHKPQPGKKTNFALAREYIRSARSWKEGQDIMDQRTKDKHMQAVRLMVHLVEGHLSRLPQGADPATILANGLAAAQCLGLEIVTRDITARAKRSMMPASHGVEMRYCSVSACGIERSCPTGDA